MSKSADTTPPSDVMLEEESDVIELTDEVNQKAQAAKTAVEAPLDELAALGLEMPEFRVPDSEPKVSDADLGDDELEEPQTERLSVEAFSHEPQSEDPQEDGEIEYDRQSMVKTIQMNSIDRSTLDSLARSEGSLEKELLSDARFSPEIIATPPQVLVKKWQEGLPGGALAILGPDAMPPLPEDEADTSRLPEVPLQEAEDDAPAFAEGGLDEESDPIELDEELIEFDEEAVTQVGPPSTPEPPREPAAKREPPPAQPSQPSQPSQPAQSSQPAEPVAHSGDPEIKGLVQELLDEKKEEKESSTRRVRPRDIWFQEVFTEEYLRTVPKNINKITEADVEFIEQSLKLKKKSRILDLACGYGRHSLELAERGYEMVGLDLSMQLLQHALTAAQKRALNVKFIHGDMREMSFSGIFDGCFIWDTSLGYFDDRTNLRVLQGVHRALKTGGRLVIDVVNRDYVVRQTPTRLWWEGKGCIFLEESEFDYHTSTLHAKRSFIYEDGSRPLEQNSYIRLYNAHELRQMLHVAGFKVLEVSGERHHRGYFLGTVSRRVMILAEKRVRKKKP